MANNTRRRTNTRDTIVRDQTLNSGSNSSKPTTTVRGIQRTSVNEKNTRVTSTAGLGIRTATEKNSLKNSRLKWRLGGTVIPLVVNIAWAVGVYFILGKKYEIYDYGSINKRDLSVACASFAVIYIISFVWAAVKTSKNRTAVRGYEIGKDFKMHELTLLLSVITGWGMAFLLGFLNDRNNDVMRLVIYNGDKTGLFMLMVATVINVILFFIQRMIFLYNASEFIV